MQLVPIKVKVFKTKDGLKYPDFSILKSVDANNSNNITRGIHGEQIKTDENYKYAIKFCIPEFADEAIKMFPDRVTKMTDEEAKNFWENNVKSEEPEKIYNNDVLSNLKIERDLLVSTNKDTTEIDAKITKALNPDDDEPGIISNKEKSWDLKKIKDNIEIV